MPLENDLEQYPNSPLRDVACEIRFPGEMEVETNRHLFWNLIRNRYPEILVPGVRTNIAPALQHYQFRSSDGQRMASVAINSLAFSETRYSGHEAFLEEFFSLADSFHECFSGVSKLNRIGWRYVNVIPYVGEGGRIPIGKFVNADICLPKAGALQDCTGLDLQLSKGTDPEVKVHLASLADPADSILLDIDVVFRRPSMKFKDYKAEVKKARAVGRKKFEDLITDEYRRYLRGEEL